MSTIEPRRKLLATYPGKEFYARMILDEFCPGGLLAEVEDFEHRGLLLLFCYSRHMNGKTSTTYIGLHKIAQQLGYTGNGHDLKRQRQFAYDLGFLTKVGTKGRADQVCLSVPERLVSKYTDVNGKGYEDISDWVTGEVIPSWDTTAPAGPTGQGRMIDPFVNHIWCPPPQR